MTGGDAAPIVKYNAKARLWKIDDVARDNISFAIDMDNADAGWMLLRENSTPDFAMLSVNELAAGKPYPAQPSEEHRKGFRVQVKIPDKLAAGKASVREFASSSLVVRRAFDSLHDAWLSERDAHPNQLPVVACKTYEEVAGKHGSNFAPIFTITSWIDRPAGFGRGANGATSDQPLHLEEPETFDDDEAFSFDSAA
jgi:hypothetical protein